MSQRLKDSAMWIKNVWGQLFDDRLTEKYLKGTNQNVYVSTMNFI